MENTTTKGEFWVKNELQGFNDSMLKQDLSEIEYNVLTERLFRIFQFKTLTHKNVNDSDKKHFIGNYDAFYDFFGLPYTSGEIALLSISNSEYEIMPGICLKHFSVSNDNLIIAIAIEYATNEYKYFNLGNLYNFR